MTLIEGWHEPLVPPTIQLGVQLRNERHLMTAEVLKRKLRNFPVANLCVRIALA
jgi:hypothetical protein